jgi:isoamylase
VGEGGYQVGNFPILWAEWNDKFRDTARRFWRGDMGQMAELGYRLMGSSDLYEDDGRHPYASINFIAAHDGFTLHDLVTYERKHNEANGEDNRDGHDNNLSANYGHEGETDDPDIITVRERQKRNLLSTLLLSQGVPMICAGDEMGRTQGGNNNGYAQDNPISWIDWNLDERRSALVEFTRELIRLRAEHPVLRRKRFFLGRRIRGSDVRDLTWIRPDGGVMTDEEWDAGWVRTLGVMLAGDVLGEMDEQGELQTDETFLLLMNAHEQPVEFRLPGTGAEQWQLAVDTGANGSGMDRHPSGGRLVLESRSLVLLREVGQ